MFIVLKVRFPPAPFEGAERYYLDTSQVGFRPSTGAGGDLISMATNISLLRSKSRTECLADLADMPG